MKYLQFKNAKYKGQRIVHFIGSDTPVDPEMTKIKVDPLFKKSTEFAEQAELAEQKFALMKRQIAINARYNENVNHETGHWRGPKELQDKLKQEFLSLNEPLADIEKQLVEHAKICEAKQRRLRIENAVYSAPGNSILLDSEQALKWKKLISEKGDDRILLENEKYVSFAEIEAERVAGLSPAAREHEMKLKIGEVMAQSMHLRNQLEISGDGEALTKAQEWFAAEKAKIERQYTS